MKKKFTIVLKYFLKHKVYLALVIIALGAGGFVAWKKVFAADTAVRYVTAKVERGALVTSLSGTGQVSASSQVDLKPRASGDVIGVYVKAGQEVKSGTLLVSLNARDALQTVRDAEDSLETAQLSLDKIKQPADQLSVLQSENSLAAAKENKQQAEDSLAKAYEDGFNAVANAFLDLPNLMTGMKDLLYGYGFADNYANLDWYVNQGLAMNSNSTDIYNKVIKFRDDVNTSYTKARTSFDQNFTDYKSASRTSDPATIENLISQTYDTTRLIADAVKNANNYLDLIQDLMQKYSTKVTIPALMTTHQNSLDSYTSKTNSQLTSLLSIKSTIENSKNSIVTNDRSIAEKTESLAQLKAGADALDLRSAELSVKQKQTSLTNAREKLADYSIRAPFDGMVAALSVKKGDTISSGSSVGTLITKQQVATIALNEVDAAKVKVGQRVNITFDAIDGLEITGEVVEMDSLGTVSQGVVSYNVKIAFDVQDDRIKPGMSLSANIILDSKNDVLLISNAAVKTQNGSSYVEILNNGIPEKKNITVGKSNDLMTEIVAGLAEGDEVITQKISTTAPKTTATSASSNNRGAMGGSFQMLR